MTPKNVCFLGYARTTGSSPESAPLFSAFGLNFLAFVG